MNVTQGEVSPGPGFQIASTVYSLIKPTTTELYIKDPPSTCSSSVTISHSAESENTQKGYPMRLATNLPPSPDSRVCKCMMDSLDCAANHLYKPPAESTSPEIFTPAITFADEKELVDSVCSKNASLCLGARADTISGNYGAFSACNSTERGSWILNSLYKSSSNDASICSFAGGVLRANASTRPTSNPCRIIMKQAGPLGTGSITPSSAFDDKNGLGSPRGLSQGAKAGIGVGTAVFLGFISALIMVGLRIRRKKRIQPDPPAKSVEQTFTKSELPDTSLKTRPFGTEIDGEELYGADGYTGIREIGGGVITELPASNTKPAELDGLDLLESSVKKYTIAELDAYPKKGSSPRE
jgi:hypothetical protein